MINMRYENVFFPDSVGFQCKNCGFCCHNQPPDINFKEQKRIELAGYKNFMQDSSNPNNRNIRRNKDGSCIFFTRENTCKINSIKPSICILEPFIITNFDYKTGKIFLGLNQNATISCKGICRGENLSVEEIGKAAQTIVKDTSEIIADKLGLSVKDKKVGFLTMKLLRTFNDI